jgi:succinate-semialdehyde dehydrogenase/glutarate-semialdehyde dehydrogenase
MRVVQSETFGPVAPVLRFDTDDEVVAAANGTPYGLAAYLRTRDIGRALRVAGRLDVGLVGVNDQRISAAEAPFGGVKLSGTGREGGPEGLDEYLETTTIAVGLGG